MDSSLRTFWKKILISIGSLKRTERVIFVLALLGALVTALVFIGAALRINTVNLPAHGGTIHEGVVGTPRFVNPLFATTQSELDLTQLVYSGLVRKVAEGEYIPDLAESYTISDDGKQYTFTLREDLHFHDGQTLDADDIIFTIESIQEPGLKSPLAVNWQGVNAQKIDGRTVVFNLSQPFAGFLDNATVGILPQHIWSTLDTNSVVYNVRNVHPIGSGPYKVSKVRLDKQEGPKRYSLRSFNDFALGEAYIKKIQVSIFPNTNDLSEALSKKAVDNAHSPILEEVKLKKRKDALVDPSLARIFGLFFNAEGSEHFADTETREILEHALNKDLLVDNVYGGFAETLNSHLPNSMQAETTEDSEVATSYDPELARSLAEAQGWTFDEESGMLRTSSTSDDVVTLSLATSNAPHLIATAEEIKSQLGQFGIVVNITAHNSDQFVETILKERNFEALLFGQSLQHDTDLYAFWHSSQRKYPGLNVSQYINARTDSLLEQARKNSDVEARHDLYRQFNEYLEDDQPMIPLFMPNLVYVTQRKLDISISEHLAKPEDRFNQVHQWHIRSHRVWERFNQ